MEVMDKNVESIRSSSSALEAQKNAPALCWLESQGLKGPKETTESNPTSPYKDFTKPTTGTAPGKNTDAELETTI